MDQKRIGHFIAKLRKEKNLTQQELADQLYVTDRAVSHWENGRRLPDISLLKNISDILGVSVNELISGEKFKDNNIIKKSDDNIIKTLKDNKKNKQIFKLIILVLSIMLILLIAFAKITLKKNIKPKIKLFSINVQQSENTKWNSNEQLHIKLYDLDSVDLCTENGNCYDIFYAFENNTMDRITLSDYLNKQVEINVLKSETLSDSSSTIYSNDYYEVVMCNTRERNNDILVGRPGLTDNLNGNICGYKGININKFHRVYHIKSIKESNNDTIDVELTDDNKKYHVVNIINKYDILPGHDYKFTFGTYESFSETVENIFNYSIIYNVEEYTLDDSISEYNSNKDEIIVNEKNTGVLHEIPEASMYIKKNSMSKTKATVIIEDYSNGQYLYGSFYKIEKYNSNGEWTDLVYINDKNTSWNSMGYKPDKTGIIKYELDWKELYGELSAGKYRIVKTAVKESDPCINGCKVYNISVEFNIE